MSDPNRNPRRRYQSGSENHDDDSDSDSGNFEDTEQNTPVPQPPVPTRTEFLQTGMTIRRPPRDVQCSICLENLDPYTYIVVQIELCGHFFHRRCIMPWFEVQVSNNTCPNCRTCLFQAPAVRLDAINPFIPPEFEQTRHEARRRDLATATARDLIVQQMVEAVRRNLNTLGRRGIVPAVDLERICQSMMNMYYNGWSLDRIRVGLTEPGVTSLEWQAYLMNNVPVVARARRELASDAGHRRPPAAQ
jgi:hypothetical protein